MTDKDDIANTTRTKNEEESYDVESLSRELEEYGLTPNESKVFLHISRLGPSTASEIARSLPIRRTEVYAILSGLQSKGIIEASLDRPARFSSLSVQGSLDLLIESQKNRVSTMERKRDELTEKLGVLHAPPQEEEGERLQILKGSEQIYARFSEMLKRAKNEVDLVAFGADLLRSFNAGAMRRVRQLHGRKVKSQLLTDEGQRGSDAISYLKEYVEVRYSGQPPSFAPHFMVVDNNELLMFTKTPSRSPAGRREATAMWTNGRALVQSMKRLFSELTVVPTASPKPTLTERQRSEGTHLEQVEFKKQLSKELTMLGFEASDDMRVIGRSGTSHEFDLGIKSEGAKPVVVDFAFDSKDIAVVPVIGFFAKTSDVKPFVNTATLVVKPKLSSGAKELAKSYGIRVAELQP